MDFQEFSYLLECGDLLLLKTSYETNKNLSSFPIPCTLRLTLLKHALSGRKRWEEYRSVIKWLINEGIWEDIDKQICEYGYPVKACSLFETKLHVENIKDALDII